MDLLICRFQNFATWQGRGGGGGGRGGGEEVRALSVSSQLKTCPPPPWPPNILDLALRLQYSEPSYAYDLMAVSTSSNFRIIIVIA